MNVSKIFQHFFKENNSIKVSECLLSNYLSTYILSGQLQAVRSVIISQILLSRFAKTGKINF